MIKNKKPVEGNILKSTFKYENSGNETATLISIQDKVDLMKQLEDELSEIENEMSSIKESNAKESIQPFEGNTEDESKITL